MATTPRFKVHTPKGEYVASCKFLEDAAALIAVYGDGATIKDARTGITVWHEGRETMPAGESYDNVRALGWTRINAHVPAYMRPA